MTLDMIQKNKGRFPVDFRLILRLFVLLLLSRNLNAQTLRRSPEDQGWVAAQVISNQILIHQTPNDASFVTDSLSRGELIWIKNYSEASDWYLVRPPEGAISWVMEKDINEIRTGEARIKVSRSQIRPGRPGARLPGPPGLELEQGEIVWLLNREPLVLPQRSGLLTWRAIEPPVEESRFARKSFLKVFRQRNEPEQDGFVAANTPGMLAPKIPLDSTNQPENQKPDLSSQVGGLPESESLAVQDNDPADSKSDRKAGMDAFAILKPPASLVNPLNEEPVAPLVLPTVPDLGFQQPNLSNSSNENKPPLVSHLKLPDNDDQALESLESRFRVIMEQPLISWNFNSILSGCEEMQNRALNPTQAARLNSLRDRAQRQNEIGQSARQFWDSMRRSRAYDPSGLDRNRVIQAANYYRFDISGLLLRSNKDVDGHLLYNLIGDSGTTIAYLKLPPAAPVDQWIGKKVGVHGRIRYHEDLRARIVYVQDVELLEPVSN
ncbi:MAG: hypothetical protein RJA81_1858 [Planctomycetota bacterium]|jgi:hypothetical protein